MPSAKTIIRRLRGSIRSSAFEHGMDAELQLHLELETEALIARGMDPHEARLTAQHRFGSVAQVKDARRRDRSDARAARGLKKSKIRNLEFGSRNSCPTKGRR